MLHIKLFGQVEMRTDQGFVGGFSTQKSRNLLAYLLLNPGRIFSRQVLCDLFWPEKDEVKAKKCLATSLWRVRTTLNAAGGDGGDILFARGEKIGISSEFPYQLDVREFETVFEELSRSRSVAFDKRRREQLDRILKIYRGDLLEGVYEEWCLIARETLKSKYLTALEWQMADCIGRGAYGKALETGHKLLSYDALLEHVHREIMICHHKSGNRPAALKQYAECIRILKRELDVLPMEETQALYRSIIASKAPCIVPLLDHHDDARTSSFPWLHMLDEALESLDGARAILRQARSALMDAPGVHGNDLPREISRE